MREFLNKYIYLTQPTILLFTLISNFYDLNYVVLGNLVGNSVYFDYYVYCKAFNVAICFFSLFLFMISVLKKYEYN